jgi:small subunit ribosomal protein S9
MTNQLSIIFQKDKIGVGKRKQSIARVFLSPGTGNITINKVSGEKYLQYNTTYLTNIMLPLKLLNFEKQFDIFVLVKGGGLTGQAEAIRLGIARLLCKIEQQNRFILKQKRLLTRDPRVKERKKYGLRKARKAPQYSKR